MRARGRGSRPRTCLPLARELLLSHDTFQQLHVIDNCVYGVFSDLVRDIDSATEETAFLRFAMTEHLLVSGRHQALCSADATRGCSKAATASTMSPICSRRSWTRSPTRWTGWPTSSGRRSTTSRNGSSPTRPSRRCVAPSAGLRRTCVRLHRQLTGLRVLFHRLDQKNTDHLSPALRIHASKLAQRLDGLDHDIVELRERSRLLEEELRFKNEEESNRHLHTLSIVTTLLLPPTLMTGIFGMNTKGLPLTDVETGFLWAAALMASSIGAAYLFMRRKGIFK